MCNYFYYRKGKVAHSTPQSKILNITEKLLFKPNYSTFLNTPYISTYLEENSFKIKLSIHVHLKINYELFYNFYVVFSLYFE